MSPISIEMPFAISKSKKNPCTIESLLKAVKETVITQVQVDALNERLRAAEKRFEEEERRKTMDPEGFKRRQYTL